MKPSKLSQSFIEILRASGDKPEIEFVKRDDLGDHFVNWVEPETETPRNGIWFYIDEINLRIVIEKVGA